MYDFEFSVIIIDYFVWLVLVRDRKVVVKGDVVIRRMLLWKVGKVRVDMN